MINPQKESDSFDFSKIFSRLLIIIPIGILINTTFTFFTTDKNIFLSLSNFSSGYLLLAILLTIIPWLTNTFRVLIWTHFFSTNLRFREAFTLVIGSELGAAVSPTAIGGAPIKAGMLVQKGIKPGTAIAITTMGSVEDGIFFCFAIPTGLTITSAWKMPFLIDFFNRSFFSISWIFGTLRILILLLVIYHFIKKHLLKQNNSFFLVSFLKKISCKVKRIWVDFKKANELIGAKGKSRLILTLFLTAIQWIGRYSVITTLVASLGISANPILFFVLQWIVFSLMTMVPTPGAAGGAEASFYLIYYSLLPHESIGLITAGWRFLTFYFLLGLGTILFFGLYHFDSRKQNQTVKANLAMSE